MRVPRRAGLVTAALSALAIVAPAIAVAATVQDLVSLATTTFSMTCSASASSVTCNAPANRFHPQWDAKITPASGQEATLDTWATTGQLPLDATSRSWMIDMHQAACAAPKGDIDTFVNKVGDLTKSGSFTTERIGTCDFTGGLTAPGTTIPVYLVSSVFVPPSPTPTVTPGPTGTPVATASTGPGATPATTPTSHPSVAPAASTSPTASPPVEPGTSASASPGATSSAAPSASPIVAGVATGPPASEPAPGGQPTPDTGGSGAGGAPVPSPTLPTFESSVLGIEDVNGDGGAIGGSLLLALLMLLIIGFAGELFNNTVENNYDEISGWFRKGPLGWLRRFGARLGGGAGPGLLAFLALTALVSSFVDPHFGLDLRSLGEFLGFLVGLIVVLASFKLPAMLAHRRRTGDLGRLRPLPWALAIAALFVLVSRAGNLQPGYLYGIVLGAIYVQEVPKKEEGRETFYGSFWTLAAAAIAWLGLTWVRGLGYDPSGFGITLLSTAFAAILVAGLEATAFGLMPLRFMPGHAVYAWNRLGWGLLFGLSIFAFVHLLISPTSGYVSQLSPAAFIAACGIFAAFGALSIATWGYFRFRPQRA